MTSKGKRCTEGNTSRKSRQHIPVDSQAEELLSADSPFAIREGYKTIRTNLIFSIPTDRCKKILLTSQSQHEGKSITATNLGIAFAENGARVLLIDSDLRLPTIARKLKLSNCPGLSDLLVGLDTLESVIYHLPNGLDVIPAGTIPPNPSELLGSPKMEEIVAALEETYQYILFDAPPIGTVTDAVVLSRLMSGVVLVVRHGFSTREGLASALNQLEIANAKLLGFIYNGAPNEKGKHYKGYDYDYSYRGARTQSQRKSKR